ncbi:Orange carotenoid-binding protein [Planktothrix tepida]|uniref:Nuclear transport factor 2 n=2 Tax=Planktothrix TaxID=54304 RepID=A0A1J1LRE7_9CYAN|nr:MULTISPECIES: nuclear transport factor 2 family protein [Planktothrix]CAD5945843.1 Orange carotenoid-binding protein [Planktothrix pseudagardhii]CAD5964903.1 Orange carotenoid-binding protein [Planktothrix tepida]CUR34975.1 Nuclear transport factor 2 [Planktothrix tepida PCC 9214]
MTTTPLECQFKLSIDNVNAIAVYRYFESFNDEDFATTASLFIPNGKLYAPFTELITGQEAIQNYLETEAKGMKLRPQSGNSQFLENGQQVVQVFGIVKTSLFSINVGWQFLLTEQEEIEEVIVKLLASALELLKISNH